ncbi:flagellar hook-associated protein FlgK [Lachnospiraceae bacterium C1.1]|nr:flagellar hook-associated protein FlgK [Lachnospiraceae bacterium C1.1]
MSSQFFGLNIGYSGLNVAASAENTVAHNIANANTTGYSKQVTLQSATDALRVYQTYGMTGTGVQVDAVSQLRNEFFDIKYWSNSADVGYYSTAETFMSTIEAYFNDTDTIKGFTSVYNEDLYNALNDLADNPSSDTTRKSLISAAQSLCEYFNQISASLTETQEQINNEIKTQVGQINTIAEEIASLNKQINMLEIQGMAANDLRDRRANLIDELSSYVDVTVIETPVVDQTNGIKTGANIYRVNVSNGDSLVDGYEYNTLKCVARENAYNQSDSDGLYDLYWVQTGNAYSCTASNLSGSLKALFEVRDGNNGENLQGTVTASTSNTLTMTVDSTTWSLFDENMSLDEFISKLSISENGYMSVGGYGFNYTGFTVTMTDSSSATVTFTGVSTADGYSTDITTAGTAGTTVKCGKSVDYKGIAFYQAEMNQWVRDFARVFNTIEKTGEDLNGNALYVDDGDGDPETNISFFKWYNKTDGTQMDLLETELSEYGGTDVTTVSTYNVASDTNAYRNYYYLTADNFRVNSAIVNDVSLMSTTAEDGDVDLSAADIVEELILIKTDKSKMEFRGASSQNFLAIIASDIAMDTSNAKNLNTSCTNIQNAIEQQRLSVSGVDEDEEALDLIRYQKSYSLNSKVISVMAEIYDRLILETGV